MFFTIQIAICILLCNFLSTAECTITASAGFGRITEGGEYESYALTRANGAETVTLWSDSSDCPYTAKYDNSGDSISVDTSQCTIMLTSDKINRKTKVKIMDSSDNSELSFTVKIVDADVMGVTITAALLFGMALPCFIALRCFRYCFEKPIVQVLLVLYIICSTGSFTLCTVAISLYHTVGYARGVAIAFMINCPIQAVVDIGLYLYYSKKRKQACGMSCGGNSNGNGNQGYESTMESLPQKPY